MKILREESGIAIIEATLLIPVLLLILLLSMQFSLATSLKMDMSQWADEISTLIANHRVVFDDNNEVDIQLISDLYPELEANNISIFIEERAYSTQAYHLSSQTPSSSVVEVCNLNITLPKLDIKSSYDKYQALYRVTLCKKMLSTYSFIPEDLFEIRFSSLKIGKYN